MKNETPYINAHTHSPTKKDGFIELETHGVGIHPWEIDEQNSEDQLKELESSAHHFIGEIGIDRSIDTPLELQIKLLVKQLLIAKKKELPVIIHTVKSHSLILDSLKQVQFDQLVLIHGFVGSKEEAINYCNFGALISFGTALIKSNKTAKALAEIPRNSILLETDDQYEYSIEDIYKQASSVINIPLEELKEQIYHNFKQEDSNETYHA